MNLPSKMDSYFTNRPRLLAMLEIHRPSCRILSCHVARKQLIDLRRLGYVTFPDTTDTCFEATYLPALIDLLDSISNDD